MRAQFLHAYTSSTLGNSHYLHYLCQTILKTTVYRLYIIILLSSSFLFFFSIKRKLFVSKTIRNKECETYDRLFSFHYTRLPPVCTSYRRLCILHTCLRWRPSRTPNRNRLSITSHLSVPLFINHTVYIILITRI